MPISGTTIAAAIKGQMGLVGFTGRDMLKLADSVGNGVFVHVITPNVVLCTVNGTAGPMGNIIHVAVAGIVPNVMSGIMKAKAASSGFSGRDMGKLFNAVSIGVMQTLMPMFVTGGSAGCAVGAGTGRFIGLNAQALSGLILGNKALRGFSGRDMKKQADAIATGITTHLTSSATFTVTVAGAVAPVPPTGPVPVAGIPSIFSKVS